MRWVGPRARTARRLDRPARPDRLRGAVRAGGRRGSSPGSAPTRCGPVPTAVRRIGASPAAGPRSAPCSWTSRCSPASATSTAPSCCSGTASRRSGRAAASTPTSGRGCGPTWSTLMRSGVRMGRIVTTRPEDRARRRGPSQRDDAHYVYRRTGLPCRICGTEVRTEVMVGPQPLLVPGPARRPEARARPSIAPRRHGSAVYLRAR